MSSFDSKCVLVEKISKRSTSSLYSAPSVVIIVELVNIAVSVFSDVSHTRPYSSNKKNASKYHASKCADHLKKPLQDPQERENQHTIDRELHQLGGHGRRQHGPGGAAGAAGKLPEHGVQKPDQEVQAAVLVLALLLCLVFPGFHGYMSSRSDQNHINTPSLMSPSSSYNNLMLQDSHDQNYQFLSNLGFELLSSPTSPYGGFRSSLLRSLTEPAASAAATPNSPGFQQYQQTMNQAPAASIRQPLQFTNNTPFWNPSTGFTTAVDVAGLRAAGTPPVQTRPANLAAKSALEGVGDSSSVITKKANADPTPLKKTRTGTPSPLPTFKVRKEKLGDRITALQQLVSPFGKTDTASVLHETIEYIKFLHEQVGAHSAPYLKNRQQVPHLKSSTDKSKDGGEAAAKRDLTGRGLCLVPISSTFAVASETPVEFWTPFGAAFR